MNPVATGLGNASGGINGLTLPATGSSPSSGVTGLLGDLGSFITGNGGKNALGIAQAINAAAQMSKSQGYATDAYNAANNQYNANAPLRKSKRLRPSRPPWAITRLAAYRNLAVRV